MAASSSSAAQFPFSGSNFSFHVGPSSLRVIAAAASLHLDNSLRRCIHRGFFLPSSPFHSKCEQQISYLGQLKDAWLDKAITHLGVVQRSDNAMCGTFLAFNFSSGEGSENTSSNGETGKSLSQPMLHGSQLFHGKRRWTDILLGVNVAVYIAQIASRGRVLSWGAKINSKINQGQVWRLVTSAFLHANLVHLMFNCVALRNVGHSVEGYCGPQRFLSVYFTSAITSSAMSYWLNKSASVGASGAIFGLIGAEAVFILRHKDMIVDYDQHLQHLMTVLAINVALAFFVKRLDHWGHVGGFLGGLASSWLLGPSIKLQYISPEGKKYFIDKPPISAVLNHSKPT